MKKLVLTLGILAIFAIGYKLYTNKNSELVSPSSTVTPRPEMLYDKYSFTRLANRDWQLGKIEIGRVIETKPEYTSYMFYYQSEGRKISGQLNMPNLSRLMQVVVMARGYVEKENYKTGIGTRNAAAVYAKNGYITMAPDFSGYGESDPEDPNALGARLTKPAEILDLLASLPGLPQADLTRVYLWGHSNGGQIMLSVAEILGMGANLPDTQTGLKVRGITLWAPVSKPFPYNILYYTDEADDKGKWLRAEIAKFEKDYDVYDYSIDRYYEQVNIPVQLHQGTADEPVPIKWSDELAKTLKEKEKLVNYYVYPGADHNMKGSWDTVVARDLKWFLTL